MMIRIPSRLTQVLLDSVLGHMQDKQGTFLPLARVSPNEEKLVSWWRDIQDITSDNHDIITNNHCVMQENHYTVTI
jgi:hypothetical protein